MNISESKSTIDCMFSADAIKNPAFHYPTQNPNKRNYSTNKSKRITKKRKFAKQNKGKRDPHWKFNFLCTSFVMYIRSGSWRKGKVVHPIPFLESIQFSLVYFQTEIKLTSTTSWKMKTKRNGKAGERKEEGFSSRGRPTDNYARKFLN